jgi:hypothetical protein
MNEFYSEQQRALQDRFETRAIADSHVGTIVHDEVQEPEKAFIEGRDMFFLSTVDAMGQPTCSYKGGDPGYSSGSWMRKRSPSQATTATACFTRWATSWQRPRSACCSSISIRATYIGTRKSRPRATFRGLSARRRSQSGSASTCCRTRCHHVIEATPTVPAASSRSRSTWPR